VNEATEVDLSQTLRERLQELEFSKIAKQYAKDARSDFHRANFMAAVALTGDFGGTGWGAWKVAVDGRIRGGITIAALFVVGSLPAWWQAERSRRSGTEHRRLQRHAATVIPYLATLDGRARTVLGAALAQRLFSRPMEDSDPLREPAWPSAAELIAPEIEIESPPAGV
jgi:hypothetical protein